MDPRALLSCFAVTGLAIAIWGHLPLWLLKDPLRRRIVLGVVMGLGSAASMLVPWHITPVMTLDLRGSLICVGAFFGGPVSAVIVAIPSLLLRAYLGEPGALLGAINTLSSAAIGLIGHYILRRRPVSKFGMTAMAAAIAVATPLCSLLLPSSSLGSNFPQLGPVMLLRFSCTWLFLLSLDRDEQLRALLDRDAIYRAVIEALPDCLTAKDRDGRFLAANPATARLMGAASAADLIGKTDADFYPPEMAEMFRAEEREVLKGIVMAPVDQEILLADQSRKWITSQKTPMLDRHGKVVGILTHNRDVTDRKRLEDELQNTQVYLQEAIDHMADGFVLYDRERRIRLFNRQYVNLFPKTGDLRVVGALFDDTVRASVMCGEYDMTQAPEVAIAERIRRFRETDDKYLELADGRTIEVRTRALPCSDTLIVFTDITLKRQLEQDLRRRASEDPLTRLANSATFEYQLNVAHQTALPRNTPYAVMMLDLDRFKPVNDTYGHAVGDELLVEVSNRLRQTVQEGMLVARLGGDEFAFLILAADIEDAASGLANRIMRSFRKPFRTGDVELVPAGSLGIAYFPSDATDPFELLRLADKALYAVKTKGGGAWAVSAAEGQMRGHARSSPPAQSAA